MKCKQEGFTLIELIIVIVILGILAVTAASRFIDVSTDTRIAMLNSVKGNLVSAANLVNYKARIENKIDCNTDPTIAIGSETITLRCGYPCPHPNGIARAIDLEDDFTWVGGNCAGRLGNIVVRLTDAPDPANCSIRYAAARSEDGAPFYTLTDSGC